MMKSLRFHISSLATVIVVLILTIFIKSKVSFSFMFGALNLQKPDLIGYLWLALRIGSVLAVILFWRLDRIKNLFQAIFITNSMLTLGLVASTARMIGVLFENIKHLNANPLLTDVILMSVMNVLTFSIWYWLIDPPGIDETQPTSAPWEFLFPQRGNIIPGYECWNPRYTDYLHLAFTNSVAFSPTDTLPLSRRAKMLMAFQAMISLISLTVIVGSAINMLG